MKRMTCGGILVAAALAAGCTAEMHTGTTSVRACCVAWRAYFHRGHSACEPKTHAERKHYAKGWRHGFGEVAAGGCGETPLMAPETYWGPAFRNKKGQAEIQAWFNGYQQGAMAAEQAGEGHWMGIPMSMPVGPPPNRPRVVKTPPAEELPAGMSEYLTPGEGDSVSSR